jgi:6-phosphogluconate dehydrogenase
MTIPIPARASADVGLISLAVMGENLALNMADHGYRVVAFPGGRAQGAGGVATA